MGFFSKLFGIVIDCPQCHSRAIDSFGGPRCSNKTCDAYDPKVPSQSDSAASTGGTPGSYPEGTESFCKRDPRTGRVLVRSVTFKQPLQIVYDNAMGVRKTFQADRTSIRLRDTRIVVAVEPTGFKICLAPKRIVNWDEVEEAIRSLAPDFDEPLQIEYTNFQSERKTFLLARNSVRRKNAHLTGAVSPSGKKISLACSRIVNWDEVEAQLDR